MNTKKNLSICQPVLRDSDLEKNEEKNRNVSSYLLLHFASVYFTGRLYGSTVNMTRVVAR